MSLDNPHVDKRINAGTTASNCQPRHTRDALDDSSSDDNDSNTTGGGSTSSTRRLSRSERKVLKKEKKIAAAARKKNDQEDPKKMGYVAMAKMGYQELVNAIIRPPRAEYKVRCAIISALMQNISCLKEPTADIITTACCIISLV